MDKLNKSIILVSYQFCPMGGIGTRRWSKFSKYLSNSGYTVHVICADYAANNNINWCHDVLDNPRIVIHRIKMLYPQFLLSAKRTFWVKLFERVFKSIFFSIDFGEHTQSILEKKLKEILNNTKTEIVITTGGSFSQFYYLAKLKKKLHFKLILDYRDPWNMITRFRGPFKAYLKKRSLVMENYSLKSAEKLFFTNNDLKNKYLSEYQFIENISSTIYNGFDIEDYENILDKKTDSGFFNIIYLGSVTGGRAEAFSLILDTIKNNTDIPGFDKIRLHVYAPDIQSILKLGIDYKPLIATHIIHHHSLPPKEAMQKLVESDACLSINEKRFSYLIGAKTYDYMALAKPILHISDGGELSEILNSNGQFVTDYKTINCKIAIQRLILNKQEQARDKYQIFELNNLTKQLIKEIENV